MLSPMTHFPLHMILHEGIPKQPGPNQEGERKGLGASPAEPSPRAHLIDVAVFFVGVSVRMYIHVFSLVYHTHTDIFLQG